MEEPIKEQTTVPAEQMIKFKNWLVESILVTIFCCMPFGVVAIVFSAMANMKFHEAQYELAKKYSDTAKKWIIAAFFTAIGLIILYVIFAMVFISKFAMLSGLFNQNL